MLSSQEENNDKRVTFYRVRRMIMVGNHADNIISDSVRMNGVSAQRTDKGFRFIGTIFLITGIVLIIIGAAIKICSVADQKGRVQTGATISAIHGNNVNVAYEVHGSTYEAVLGYYSSNMSVGDEVEIYVNPVYPTDFAVSNASSLLLIIFSSIGAFFALMGGLFVFLAGRNNSRLVQEVEPIYAQITGWERRNMYINGVPSYKLKMNGKDDSGQEREFAVNITTFDPEAYVNEHPELPVYISKTNPKSYYVETI